MNKKNKYIKPSCKTSIDTFDLFYLTHPIAGQFEKMRPLWDMHRAAILEAWKEIFPATRPRIFWLLEHPQSHDKLCQIEQSRIDKSKTPALKAYPTLADEKAELIRLGLLDDNEIEAEPKAFCFSDFCERYKKVFP